METLGLSNDQMCEDGEAPMLRSSMEISDGTGSLEVEMGQKENLCSVQEDNLGTSMQRKRNRKGGGCNLRKSLAWNHAFFTEEGVLDQRELTLLNRSSTKSSGNLMSVSEMSPLTAYNKSSVRPPLHDLVTNSRSKDAMPRKLFSSSIEKPEVPAAILGKTPSAQGAFRNISRLPATHSHKRVANASTTNPTSKLPKFMPAKSHVPLPTISRNATLSTKTSNYDQSVAKVKVGQNVSVRLADTKMDLAYASSSSNHLAGNQGKKLVDKCIPSSKAITNRSSSAKLHKTVTRSPGKVAHSLPQMIKCVPGGPPAPLHARPSALRMPSPSLGFFCQGKVSPSYNNQHPRHTQPSESKIPPLRQPLNLRLNGQLRPLTTTVGQQPRKGTAAENSSVASVISSSSQAYFTATCLEPPATDDTHLPVETNTEMKQADISYRRAPIKLEGSYCHKDNREQSGFDHLVLCQDTHEQPGVLPSGKPGSDRVKELDYGDSSSNITNESFAQGIQQSPKTNVTENVCDDCPPIRGSRSNISCSNESQACSLGKLQECDSKEVQVDSGLHTLARHSHDDVARDGTYPVAIENQLSAGNSDFTFDSPIAIANSQSAGDSDFASGFTDRSNNFGASTESKMSLKEETRSAGLNNSSESDYSLSPSSGICDQVARPGSVCMTIGLNSMFSEKYEPAHFEEKEPEDCRSNCNTTNASSSRKQDLLMSGNVMDNNDTSRQVLLNAVPFSDEWVAALEAVGEDILEKKTGPVQNSPPDKALPEPGSWSPVKKKAQDIGPYDCTKYSTNIATSKTH